MRKFVILRGLPSSGKSTFVKENNLEAYTVSSDAIRLLVASTNMDVDGDIGISAKEDRWVWEKIYEILEIRFKKGLFTVFDATNIRASDMNAVKQIANKYGYKVYCVDFTDVPVEVIKERNRNRISYARVPDFVIDRMNDRLKNATVPADIEIINRNNFESIFEMPVDMSRYDAVHFVGDIHGCYDALMELIDNEIKENEAYVFCGDYVDRGTQNAEVIRFLLSIYTKKNVFLLRGNHEKHLIDWSNGNKIVSDIFYNETREELEKSGVSTKKVRRMCESLRDCAYITYNGQTIFACHGGIASMPEKIDFLASDQMIRGVGKYTDCEHIEQKFFENSHDVILVHGHRNISNESINPVKNVYNLENAVEFGGTLRMVSFTKSGIVTKEVVNTNFKQNNAEKPADVQNMVEELRGNEYVLEKPFGNVSSFNFTRKAFDKGIWDKQTITARGLYIDTQENKIVARSYDKFFRVDEVEDTMMETLKKKLVFPITAYKKENGFLGIFSAYNGEPFFATKSSIDGDFNGYFKDLMCKIYGENTINRLCHYCNKNNCTMVFEVVDIENDPHIIEYGESTVILLDIIENKQKFTKLPFKELCKVAQQFGLKTKQMSFVFYTFKEFEKFISTQKANTNYTDDTNSVEGYVFEDSHGFMFKTKTEFYNFWKFMRSVTSTIMKYGRYRKEEDIKANKFAVKFHDWILEKYNNGVQYNGDKIIEIRKEFLAEIAQ